jgi:colanic acid biosynthesis glycosyl transferase WcaI
MARVLILSLVFRPDNVSTAQLMADLAGDLQARGHSVTVLTTVPHYNPDPEAADQQPLSPCWWGILQQSSYRGMEVFHAWMPRKGQNKLYRLLTWVSFHLISTLAGLWKVQRPDVILSPSPPLTIGLSAWVLAAYHHSRFIYNLQEMYPDVAINLGVVRNRSLIHWLYGLERFVYRKAAAVTAISERMRVHLIQKGVPEAKVLLIPNFVDVHDFRPLPKDNEFSRKYGLQSEFVVSYAGNMGKPQHLETLLHTAALLADRKHLRFVIMGDGSEREDLEQLARQLRLHNLTFLPYQPYSLMPLAYAAADASYVPQAIGTSNDGVPSKVYRIMASGRPVLACTDADSDLADLVLKAEAGAAVTTAAPAELAKTIEAALANESAWLRLGSNGRAYVLEHYDRMVVVGQYHELINKLAAAPLVPGAGKASMRSQACPNGKVIRGSCGAMAGAQPPRVREEEERSR